MPGYMLAAAVVLATSAEDGGPTARDKRAWSAIRNATSSDTREN